MGYFLGIDLGTSYFKAGLFDSNGRLQGLGRQFVEKDIRNDTTCEVPVDTFWGTLRNCVGEAVQAANINPKEIRSISYSSQANSFILLDSRDKPLTPLVLWPDKRAKEDTSLIELIQDKAEFYKKTGLGVDLNPKFLVAKLSWFKKTQLQIWERTKSIMSISDYFVFELTGQRVGDLSTASMTGMLDTQKCQWWYEMLELFNIETYQLPIPQRVGTLVGPLTTKGAQYLGLQQGIPFYLGGLDHHIAAIGAGLPLSKNISESTGTVLACVNYQECYLPQDKICIAPGLEDNHYFQMVFDENGAASLEWYQKKHAPEFSIPELLEMAANIGIGSEGLIARPCAHKFRGLSGFKNVKQTHRHGHFTRSILESTALSLSRIVAGLSSGAMAVGIVPTGGGAKSRLWVKIKSDMLGKSFIIPECSETACLGAAMLGAIGAKEYNNINEAIEGWARHKKIIYPDPANTKGYKDWCLNNILLFE